MQKTPISDYDDNARMIKPGIVTNSKRLKLPARSERLEKALEGNHSAV